MTADKTINGLHCAEASSIGKRRLENQDSYCTVRGPEFLFAAVADGMGGARGGAVASSIAVDVVARHIALERSVSEPRIRESLRLANEAVVGIARREPALRGMGTTFAAVAVTAEDLYIANIGDSRVYRLREGRLHQLTQDHTVVGELLRAGTIAPEDLGANAMSHLLSRSLGADSEHEAECWRGEAVKAGDLFLLCTDGLYNNLSYEALLDQLKLPGSAGEKVQRLVAAANEAGGSDNITAIVVEAGPDFGSEEAAAAAGEQNVVTICTSTTVNQRWSVRQHPPSRARRVRQAIAAGLAVLLLVAGAALLRREGAIVGGMHDPAAEHVIAKLARQVPQSEERFRDTLSEITNALSLTSSGGYETKAKFANWMPFTGDAAGQGPRDGTAPGEDRPSLDELRARIDVETRKLAVWYERRKLCQSVEPHSLAAAVAVTSEPVRERKAAFETANWIYLEEAEKLLYNPADEQQEARVAELRQARDAARDALNTAVREAIDRAVGASLQRILDLAIARDKLMAEERRLKRSG